MGSFLRISGDYSDWNVYKKAVIVSDVTELFIRRVFKSGNRTADQMRQAARSCKQNIVEGIIDGTISIEMCIKLLGVARGSLRELLEDYQDFLRQNELELWDKNDERTRKTRAYCVNHSNVVEFTNKCKERSDETVANIMVTQIRQLDAMLASVLRKLEGEFLKSGGIKEAMFRARVSARDGVK